jgi:cyclophilin family peptidyl-prolyl cis-trans isomerase
VLPDDDQSSLAVEYRKDFAAFRDALVVYADAHARIQYRMGEAIENEAREKWLVGLKAAYRTLVKWRESIAKIYASDPTKYQNQGLLLREMLLTDGVLDRLDDWVGPVKALLEAKELVDEDVLLYAGYAGFMNCDFELAELAWGSLLQAGKLGEQESRMLSEIPSIAESWKNELARREEDKTKNNPRVEIMTTKGTMVVELFEDDAPESVANFIYLVENGYYTRKPIFLVKQHWLAQTGCEKGDGKGSAGFTIKSEAQEPTRRSHFRGSLAVPIGFNAQTQQVDFNSGGAQFYFSFLPLPLVDGRHTVFGRIETGMEVMGMFKVLNLTDEEERKNQELRPDTIIRAKVLSKRDHEYRPTPVFGKLPR